MGLLGQVLHKVDGRIRVQVIETVRAAYEPFVRGEEVHFTSACWLVAARAPAGWRVLEEGDV